MSKTALKTQFRQKIKQVAGGPVDKTRGAGLIGLLDGIVDELLSLLETDPQTLAGELNLPDGVFTEAPAAYQRYTDLVAYVTSLVLGVAPWVAGPQKAGTLVYNDSAVWRVKTDLANSTTGPTQAAPNAANYDFVGGPSVLAALGQVTANTAAIGTLTNLSTVAKANLVAAINELFTSTQSVTSAVWGYNGGGQTTGFADLATGMVSRRGTTLQLNAAICPLNPITGTIYNREIYGQGRYILTGSDGVVPAYLTIDSVKFIGSRGILVKCFAPGAICKITDSQLPTLELEATAVANVHASDAGVIKGAAGSVVNLYSGCTYSVDPANQATINDYTKGGSGGGSGGVSAADLTAAKTILPLTPVSASRALVLADLGTVLDVVATSGTPPVITVPSNSTLALPVGAHVEVRQNGNATQVMISGENGVAINAYPAGASKTAGNYASVFLHKVDLNTWVLSNAVV